MPRTREEAFVNRYLNGYQNQQQQTVNAGSSAASTAANKGITMLNQAADIELPTLWDPTSAAYSMVLDAYDAQVKAQEQAAKAQEKAAKAAQKAAKEAVSAQAKANMERAKAEREAAQEQANARRTRLNNKRMLQLDQQKAAQKPAQSWAKAASQNALAGANAAGVEFKKEPTTQVRSPILADDVGHVPTLWDKIISVPKAAAGVLFSDEPDGEAAARVDIPTLSGVWAENQAIGNLQESQLDAEAQAVLAARNAVVDSQAERNAVVNQIRRDMQGMAYEEKRALYDDLAARTMAEQDEQAQADLMEQARAALDVLEDDPQYAVEREQQITNTPEVERIRQYAAAGQLDKWAEDDAKALVEKYASENPGYLWEEWAQQHPIDAETVASGGNFFGGLFGSRYKGVPIEEIYADYAEMSEAEKQTAREISLLSEKASNAAALGYGATDAIPFYATLADMAARGTQEALEMDGGVLPSERMEATQQQSPIAYTGGNLAGSMALYGGLSAAASGIPALQSAGAAIASTRPAQAVSNIPVLGRLASQQAITGALADALPDMLDNAEVVWQGYQQNAQQADILANPTAYGYADEAEARAALMEANGGQLRTGATPWLEGAGNAALNIGANAAFELVPELVRTGRNALQNRRVISALEQGNSELPTLNATQSADNVFRAADEAAQRRAAETAQKPIDDIVTAWRNGTLTNAQMETLKPGGSNRAAFEAVTGTTLPGTSGETRRFLRQNTPGANVDNNAARVYDEINNMEQGGALNERTGENAVRGMAEDAEWSGTTNGDGSFPGWVSVGGNPVLRQFLTPTENINAAIERFGATPLELVDTTGNPQFFSFALEQARRANPHGLMVSGKTVDELSLPGTVTFMSKDGLAGALVTVDGDIEAVFKNPRGGAKGAGGTLLLNAVNNGGNKLDCYGERLVALYNMYGFEPVAKVPWNPEYAPDGWTYGPQDVYVMKLADGLDADGVAARLGLSEADGGFHTWSKAELDALPAMDYEEALAYRDSLIHRADESTTGNPLPTPDLLLSDATSAPIPTPDDLRTTNPLPTVGGIGETMDGTLPESIGAMRHDAASYSALQNEYGTIAPGENAARVVDVPISTDGTDRVSASARTFMEAPQTTDELVGMFEKGVEDGLFSHDVKRDADSLARAVSAVEQDGYQNILTSWKNLMRTGASPNKEQIVQGQLLYTLAAKNGDTATAMELAGDLARIATEAGQNLQAQRLLKRMTPEGKLYYAQQTVDSLNRQLKQQLGDGFQDIKIPEELARPLMEAKDAKAQNDAMQNIYQYVADQLPTDWGTRWNAWRYLAMLSNPATHVRNVLSNAVNVPARKFKNILGAGIERLTLEEGQRTKSIINPLSASDRSLVEFAKNDIENVMPQLTGAQKYSDRSAIKQMIDPFKVNGTWGKNADSGILAKGARRAADAVSGGLSSAYKFNSWALGAEDMLFKKGAYVDSLSQYLKANGIDPAKATQKQLDAAREYAVEEALRATYTEFNSLAQAIGKLERTNLGTKVFIGGTVPFKSTPLNIIRRGVRYSPVGLMESVTNGVRRLRAGEINANQFIDNISQGLSGTAIFGLGMWLGANGIINGISPENKKEQSLKSSQGWQNYSINLPGGGTYTIDWGGPSVMAILAGVETAKAFEQDGYGINEALTALGNITEPMFDTTMLDGVNSAIQSATYAGSNPVTALASQAASNFVTQAIPSLSGVVARAYDPIRRTTYSDKEGASGAIDESKQRIMNKVPGASTGNQPYIDVWGREQENPGGSFVGRLAYGLLSPGYYSPDRSTVADDVVEGLYEATGDSGTLPGSFNGSVTVDGEKIKLSPENYTLAKQTKGQASQQMIESLYDYPQYNAMDAEVQADVVKGVYDLANDVAKYQVIPSLYDDLVSEIESGEASKSEMLAAMYLNGGAEQVIPYLVADELTSDVRADKNAKGNSIPGSREKNFVEILLQYGYTSEEAEYLYQLLK